MPMTPIELTLYDPETNEAKKTYTRSFIPWAILKRAISMKTMLSSGELTEQDVDELASLVVAVFGDQFSLDEISKGADIGEMISVIKAVITRAGIFVEGQSPSGNPTPAAR